MPIVKSQYCRVGEEDIVNKRGNMLVLDAMLSKLKEKGHRVLFSLFSYQDRSDSRISNNEKLWVLMGSKNLR